MTWTITAAAVTAVVVMSYLSHRSKNLSMSNSWMVETFGRVKRFR